MATSYTYSLASDFGGNIHQQQLHKEVDGETGITSASVTGVSLMGDVVSIAFDGSLTGGEQTTLDSVVSSHTAVVTAEDRKASDTTTTTTLNSYQVKAEIDTDFLPAGDYKISWYYNFLTDDGYLDACVLLDDATILHEFHQRTQVVSSTYVNTDTGFTFCTLTEGSHNLKLQFRSETKSSVTIKNARLLVEPLP